MISLILIFFVMSFTTPSESGKITIEFLNLRNNKGQVCLSIFKDGKGYYDKPELATHTAVVPIVNGKATYTTPELAFGSYAVVAIHDENKSNSLSLHFLGYPIEGIAVSNNAIGRFWQIKDFDTAKLLLNSPHQITSLKMVY